MKDQIRVEVGEYGLMRRLVGEGEAALMAFDPPYNTGKRYAERKGVVGGGDRLSEVEYRRMAFDVAKMGIEIAGGRMAVVLSRKVLPIWVTAFQTAGLDVQVVVVLKRAAGVLQRGMVGQWIPVVVTCAPVADVRVKDVWDDVRVPGEGYFFREGRWPGHPAPTSVELMTRIVRGWSREGELVVDPFCGCGATALACLRLGRRFVGVDREQRFVEGIVDRIAMETEQEKT